MSRWMQLLLGLVCMIVISSPQYGWALFTQPLTAGLGSSLAQLQITQLDQLSTTNLSALSSTQLQAFTGTQVASFDDPQLEAYLLGLG